MDNSITYSLDKITVQSLDVSYTRSVIGSRSKHCGGGKRGVIKSLSRQSRTRLLHTTRNIPDVKHIITFTYPDEKYAASASGGNYMIDGEAVKQHIRKLRQMLVYRGLYGIWFLEFQKRGAPHFHFFCGGDITPHQALSVRRSWFRMVGSSCPNHLERGSDFQLIRKKHAAGAYAAKYSTKDEQKTVPSRYVSVGRFWGRFGKFPRITAKLVLSTRKEFYDVTRVARRWTKAQNRANSFQVVCDRGKGLTGQIFWNTAVPIQQYLDRYYQAYDQLPDIEITHAIDNINK